MTQETEKTENENKKDFAGSDAAKSKNNEPAKSFDENDNSIFIGGKPLMNYVTGVVMRFTKHDAKEVTIKSRGKFISKAVDAAEVARRKFLANQNISVKEVRIGSEEFKNTEGKLINVSTLEIVLVKN